MQNPSVLATRDDSKPYRDETSQSQKIVHPFITFRVDTDSII